MKKENSGFGLMITPVKTDNDKSCGWTVGIVSIEGLSVRNVTDGPFDDLNFRTHISWLYDARLSLAFYEVCYRSPYNVDLARAEVMLKTLKRAQKVSASLPVNGLTFAQWCVLVADALGIRYAVKQIGRSSGWHNTTEYYIGPVREAQGMIERELDALRRAVLPTPEELAQTA